MTEIGDAIKAVFARMGSFFDLFDPSFFVSGSVALGGILLWIRLSIGHVPVQFDGWLKVLAVILGCYVGGLICFAVGRWVRIPKRTTKQTQYFETLFMSALRGHGLQSIEEIKNYIDRQDVKSIRRLYIRLWAEIRQTNDLAPSLSVVNRYWVMAATYDGLATAVGLWAVLIFFWTCGFGITPPLSAKAGIPIFIALLLCSIACLREANRFVRNQVEELVATIARECNRH